MNAVDKTNAEDIGGLSFKVNGDTFLMQNYKVLASERASEIF